MVLVLAVGTGCARSGASRAQVAISVQKGVLANLVAQRDWEGAIELANALLTHAPDDMEVRMQRGRALLGRGMLGEAISDLRVVAEEEDEWVLAQQALGIALDRTQQTEEAQKHHRRAAELAPEDVRMLNNLAFSLHMSGKTEEAEQVYKKALKLNPTEPRVRNNLGFLLAQKGDLPGASKQFELGGTEAEAKNNLGFAYEMQGNLRTAHELYLKALELEPELKEARSNLAYVARRLEKDVVYETSEPSQP
jgi:Flp pilus assembly protein TadD